MTWSTETQGNRYDSLAEMGIGRTSNQHIQQLGQHGAHVVVKVGIDE
jgi:hypothetical protein